MAQKVFVSPGVYTSEKDLTFVTRQVGVTTLGLVGETTLGPAFQPIFIGNYGEFQSFFGGLNATKVKENGAPLYELPYIAKSYLSQSNQLFVTRVLGLSGYDAGQAWGITIDGALDPSTVATTSSATTTTTTATTTNPSPYSLMLASGFTSLAGTILNITNAGTTIPTGNIGEATFTGVPPTFGTGSDLGASPAAVANVVALHTTLIGLTGTLIPTPANIGVDDYGNGAGVFVPGVYYTSSAIDIALVNPIITLSGSGDYVFVSQLGAITTCAGATVILTNGAESARVFWVANNAITLGATNIFKGNLLAGSAGAITIGSTVDLEGRMLTPDAISIDGTASTFTLPTATTVTTGTTNAFNQLISFTATSAGTVVTLVSSIPLIQSLINDGSLINSLGFLGTANTGATASVSTTYLKTGSIFSGISFDLLVTQVGTSGIYTTGMTSGITITYSGAAYSDVENQLIALLRSRGTINVANQSPAFEITGTTNGPVFNPSLSGAATNPLGVFSLSGVSNTQGIFNYQVSMDKTQVNYLPKVLGRSVQDGNTALFAEEFFDHMFKTLNAAGKIRGIKQSIVNYSTQYSDYLTQYHEAQTPYVVSELRGNKVLRLFRFNTISDGNAANEQFKISIVNIKPDAKEFDVHIRAFYDTDAQPTVLESFSRCTMNPASNNYIGRKIGTLDGEYVSKSSYVLVDIDDTSDTSEAFPAGFIGYPIRNYQAGSNSTVVNPDIMYKQVYGTFENKRKRYLGLSETVGIDADFFDYKGVPATTNPNVWTGMTNGFHMDVDATGVTIDNVYEVINISGGTYSPIFLFDVGDAEFRTDAGLDGTPYEKIYARKFTFVPYGGFDGWDIYNTRRTNTDKFLINGVYGAAGLASGAFTNRTLSNGDLGINSDYYAYLEAIWTFKNPEAVNINVFATPGIDNFDNTNLIEATIDMIEKDRADSLYIMTTPDTDSAGDVLSIDDVVGNLDGMYDSNYSCTYWPWVQINDAENNVFIYVPPTRDVVRNIALTDNIAFPWFAVAGIQRGDVDAIQARKKLTLSDRDNLYENRINPIATFTSDGIKIWGNKTLQVKESALNRINVRRLLLQARKLISAVSIRLLFEQNDAVVRNQFLALVNPILDNIRTERGLTDFRVVLSKDPEDIDRNQLTGQIFLKPTRALEFIQVEFVIMNTGASFDNI